MPRPTKAFRRQKIQAGIEWKRGNREEAYKLWSKASASLKEARNAKRNRKKIAAEAAAAAAAEAAQAEKSEG